MHERHHLVHIHTCIHIFIHACMHAYRKVELTAYHPLEPYMHAYHKYTHAHIHANIYTCVHTYMSKSGPQLWLEHTHSYTQTYIHTHTHMHTYIPHKWGVRNQITQLGLNLSPAMHSLRIHAFKTTTMASCDQNLKKSPNSCGANGVLREHIQCARP